MPVQLPGVFLDTSVLDKITKDLKPGAKKVVNQYGKLVTATAMSLAPVDTGALKASIGAESDMVDDLTYRVQDGVQYGVFQELGTHRMAAHPFIVPAVEKWADKFLDAIFALIEGKK